MVSSVSKRSIKNFFGVSGSVGATYKASEQFLLRANIARGFRAPTISELAANGVHEGSLRYEKGNSSLKPETSWQLDMGADFSSPIVSAQLSLFANLLIKNVTSIQYVSSMLWGKPTHQGRSRSLSAPEWRRSL